MVRGLAEEEKIDECEVEGAVDVVEDVPGDDDPEERKRGVPDERDILPRFLLVKKERDDAAPVERGDGQKIEYQRGGGSERTGR